MGEAPVVKDKQLREAIALLEEDLDDRLRNLRNHSGIVGLVGGAVLGLGATITLYDGEGFFEIVRNVVEVASVNGGGLYALAFAGGAIYRRYMHKKYDHIFSE